MGLRHWVMAAEGVQMAIKIGVLSGAAVSAAMGQIVLAVVLLIVLAGLALRFKRGRVATQRQTGRSMAGSAADDPTTHRSDPRQPTSKTAPPKRSAQKSMRP